VISATQTTQAIKAAPPVARDLEIDWVSVGLAFVAMVAVLGLLPLWAWVISVLRH